MLTFIFQFRVKSAWLGSRTIPGSHYSYVYRASNSMKWRRTTHTYPRNPRLNISPSQLPFTGSQNFISRRGYVRKGKAETQRVKGKGPPWVFAHASDQAPGAWGPEFPSRMALDLLPGLLTCWISLHSVDMLTQAQLIAKWVHGWEEKGGQASIWELAFPTLPASKEKLQGVGLVSVWTRPSHLPVRTGQILFNN